MTGEIVGLALLVVGIIAAFFAGKRKERTDNDTDTHNEWIATKARIEAATRPNLSDDDVADSLRDHAK